MRFNYLKFILIAVVLSIVIMTVPQFATRVYAGAQNGVWDQLHVAIYSQSSGAVGTQIGGDDETYGVEPGAKIFVVVQANFSTQSKDQDIEISWRQWAGTWAVASPKGTGSGTVWEFWDSNYATLGTATKHFTGSVGSVYIEDQDSDGNDPGTGLEEFWFVVEAPTATGRYELAISEDGIVTDSQGTITQQIDITVGTPPSVSTQAASSIGDNGATLNGNITDIGSDSVIERGFEWGYTTSYGSSWTEEGTFGTGTFNHAISGLDSGTTYHFRAKARNSVGWAYGADIEFTTTGLPTKPYLRVVQGNPRKGSATWWEWIVVNPTGSTITVTEVRVVDDTGTDWGWTADNTQGYPASGWTDGGTGGYYWSGSETVSAHSAKVFRSRPVQANISPSTSHTMTWSITVTGYSPAPQQTQVW